MSHQQLIIVKKPNVFRVKFPNGNEYLFNAKDDVEMNDWINLINNCIASSSILTSTTPPIPTIALTSPPTNVGSSSPRQPPVPTMVTSTSGVEMTQQSSGSEPKSRTLPLRSSSSVEPPVSTQQAPTGKKNQVDFFQ